MSTSTTKYKFLSGGSQQIKLTELSSEGIGFGLGLASNGSGGWHTFPLSTCGLSWLGNTGTGSNQYFEFDSLCILRHPMDY